LSTDIGTGIYYQGDIADRSYVYLRAGSPLQAIRISVDGGSSTKIGDGSAAPYAVNSTNVFLADSGNSGASLAIHSVPLASIGTTKTLVGDYGTRVDLWGGVVADEQYVYWSGYSYEKVTNFDAVFLFKCSVSGCGNNPTVVAKGTNYPTEHLYSDGTALYLAGPAGIFKVAK